MKTVAVNGADIKILARGVLNSYSQVFFSENRLFSLFLLLVSFADIYAGTAGLMAVLIANLTAFAMGLDRGIAGRGLYGFNSLLVGLSLGIYFSPGPVLYVVCALAAVLTLFISVSLHGVIGKYGLPFLSMPFVLSAWILTLATRNMEFLGISERGIFTVNELYGLGGSSLVNLYEWWNSISIIKPLKIYFISLGAIFFQFNVLSGIIIAAGLLYYSRISFSLSLIGFFTAYAFYQFVGADITEINYSYIGFNYILTSVAVGGFFIIPSMRSYLWSVLLVPLVALLSISLYSLFVSASLPIYALPFNLIVLLFLYVLKFRVKHSGKLTEVVVQQNSPEKNLYSYENVSERYRFDIVSLKLPFFGEWHVSQGYDTDLTHMGHWKHGLDFVVLDKDGNQFRNNGDFPEDYYCFNRPVLAAADGVIELVIDNIDDNIIGQPNLRENWGNSVIIRHNSFLFSSLSHLKKGSVTVKAGERVRQGDLLGRCGNSGRSPFPHLHFQVQSQPYIGSATMHYPIGYFIEHSGSKFELRKYSVPGEGSNVSGIQTNGLLVKAFDLVPGKVLCFEAFINGRSERYEWEVFTNEYNTTYVKCLTTSSLAYFSNDGSMFLFRHYEGKRDTLLYYFFQACFRVQLGFYRGMEVADKFPLNLTMKRHLLFFQDFIAPFARFLKSEYSIKYDFIDNDIDTTRIRLVSSASNYLAGKLLSGNGFVIEIDSKGITSFTVRGEKRSITANACRE